MLTFCTMYPVIFIYFAVILYFALFRFALCMHFNAILHFSKKRFAFIGKIVYSKSWLSSQGLLRVYIYEKE